MLATARQNFKAGVAGLSNEPESLSVKSCNGFVRLAIGSQLSQ
jgi:hypothetical protein